MIGVSESKVGGRRKPSPLSPKKPAPNIGKYGLPIREGAKCRICDREWKPGDRPFHSHHLAYQPNPVLATLCPACHIWMNGQGKVFNHRIKRDLAAQFGEEEAKALAPLEFALRVVEMYDQLLFIPELSEAIRNEQLTRLSNVPGGTVH